MADIAMVDTNTKSVGETKGGAATTDVDWQRDTTLNIHQRIHAVMEEVAYASKEDVHTITKDGRKVGEFNYTSHDAATEAVRVSIVRHGILIIPTMTGHQDNGNRVEIDVRVDFINIDDPQDRIEVDTLGYGVDKYDKGPGKAMSYAVKLIILKAFQLIGGNEPEDDNIEHDPAVATASKQEAAEHDAVMKHSASLNNLKAALETAQSAEEVDRLRRDNSQMFKEIPENTRKFFADLMDRRKDEFAAAAPQEAE